MRVYTMTDYLTDPQRPAVDSWCQTLGETGIVSIMDCGDNRYSVERYGDPPQIDDDGTILTEMGVIVTVDPFPGTWPR